jgi:Tol biopolymer transport system component
VIGSPFAPATEPIDLFVPEKETEMKRVVIFAAIVALTMPLLVIGGGVGQAKPFGMNGRIAFVRVVNAASGEEKQRATYLVDPDGTNPQLLPVGTSPDPAPLWSPDGSRILVGIESGCASGGACGQIIVDVATGSFYQLPAPDAFTSCPPVGDCGETFFGCHAWSPDGARLACSGSSEIAPSLSGIYTVRSSDGGDLTLVTNKFPGSPVGDYSPNGRRLVVEANDDAGGFGLFVVKLNGGGLRQITPQGMLLNPDLTDGGSWSPLGGQIVTWAESDEDHRFSIWTVAADGSGVHEVPIPGCGGLRSDPHSIGCRRPVWSPDGTKIVFERRNPVTGEFDIYSVNANGTGLMAIARTGLDEGLPDWGTHPLVP